MASLSALGLCSEGKVRPCTRSGQAPRYVSEKNNFITTIGQWQKFFLPEALCSVCQSTRLRKHGNDRQEA